MTPGADSAETTDDAVVDYIVELVDGPAKAEHRTISTPERWPKALIDIELEGGHHAAYLYVGRRGELDPEAWAYGWDRQQPTTTPSEQPEV